MVPSIRSKEEKRVLIGLSIAFLILWLFIYVGEIYYNACHKETEGFDFWVQLMTGSSWPALQEHSCKRPLLFAFGAALNAMLSAGPLLGIGWVWLNLLLKERREVMTLADLLYVRDAVIRLQIRNMLGQLVPEQKRIISDNLDKAFQEGSKSWEDEHLNILLGEEAAEMFRARIRANERYVSG